MTTTIRLGALVLDCRPGIGSVPVTIKTDDFGEHHVLLNHVEFQSLVRTAAVLTAARQVCNRRMEHRAPNRDTFLVNDVEILGVLAAAIDALDAGGDK